ncbi:MAG: DegV family EDD domain-containing protein [Gemmatimonadetes bacterium]|nr:DegV family EDD domain-containing protein [Gemmatimonadota bacterium]MBT8403321.1 DegV family EDD domain-containing protein [Gemmatimonadota bacterium]NNK64347.1 DegV family EDD domain-containing protein [Gemmatimonadota bacterium]
MKIAYIDGPRLRRSLVAACDHAQRQRAELNRINVFPVPDGDTGTNLSLTVRAIADHLRGNRDRDVSAVADAAAQAAVLGARGNCGMMLSHFLLGFSGHVGQRERLTTNEFGGALKAGVENLYAAMDRPMEGTILTVMRDTATAAEDSGIPDFEPLIDHLVDHARSSLARTPDLLPVLRKAGVVDAGAKGFVSLLEGVLLFINGDPIVAPEPAEAAAAIGAIDYPDEEEQFRFCTEALVRGPDLPEQRAVRDRLRDMGDSLIVIRATDVLKVHIHTDDPEDVFAYLRGLGTLATHKAEDMKAQHAAVERSARGGHVTLARRPVSIITDSAADLPEEVVRAHGIQVTPLLLVSDDATYRDGVEITAEEFHRRLDEAPDTLPTTSQPAPADFLEAYGRAAEDGEEIVGVILGSSLSGTFGSADAASKRFHGAPIHLMDSLGASLLQGLLVLKAAELAELATPPTEIVAELQRIRRQSGILFTVDTFDRLLRSGRVGRGRAILGSLMQVKPVLGLTRDGVVEPAGKAIGRKRVMATLIDAVRARIPEEARKIRFGVVHVGCPEIVPVVKEALRDRFGSVEMLSAPATPVISTHLGTGAWGVAYLVED